MGIKSGLLASLAIVSCLLEPGYSAAGDTWEVLLKDLPARVSTEDAGINMSLYVLKQTHEPLFRIDDGENYTSKLLKSWKRDISSSRYQLCPDTGVEFANGKRFDYGYFLNYVSALSQKLAPGRRISEGDGCVSIDFGRPRHTFLEELSTYEHAPSIKISTAIELGLGPFYATEVLPDRIVLKRRTAVRGGYNSIVVHRYTGAGDANLENRQISDFNKMQISTIPEWVKSKYLHFESIILQTVILIINHPDENLRKYLYNCLDADGLRRAFYPSWKEFVDVKNILPIGVPGAVPGRPEQDCRIPPGFRAPAAPLIFINFAVNNDSQMGAFVSDFERRTGIKISLQRLGDRDFEKTFFQAPRGYQLAIVAMDAVTPDHSAFFDYLIRSDGYFDYRQPAAEKYYSRLRLEVAPDAKADLARRIVDSFASGHVALPLLQVQRRYYYPREIKNLTVGRGFLEYPEVADFRW